LNATQEPELNLCATWSGMFCYTSCLVYS